MVTTSKPVPSVRNAERLPEIGDILVVSYPYDNRLPKHPAIVVSECDDTGAFDIVIFTMSALPSGTQKAILYVGQRGASWEFKDAS